MKSNLISINLAILIVLILIIQSFSLRSDTNNFSETESESEATKYSNEYANSVIAKGPSDSMLPFRNAVGHKMKKVSILTKFPMKVKSCDQIAFFPAKYIADFADYKIRKTGYFAINAHSVAIYKDKDSKKLINYVLWGNIKKKPSHLIGGKGCITIDSASEGADISVCFPSKSTAKNLLKVIDSFYKCRSGDNLQPMPKELFRKLKQVCGKNGKIISGKKHKKMKMSLKARAGNKWDSNRMRYNHPEPIRVPGTFRRKTKK